MVEPIRSTCGSYIILQTLGEGSFGTVKKALNIDTETLVALKVMKPNTLDTKLEKEISALQMLKHPNIANIIEILYKASYKKKNGKVVTRDVIVMELADKADLFAFLKLSFNLSPSGFPEPILRGLVRQLVEVVEYCHQNGIVHRDIKPENILLDAEYNIKLADFGWAAVIDNKYHKTIAGTKYYEAPEMRTEEGYELEPIDIFALGAVLFSMKCGHRPFGTSKSVDPFYKLILNGQYESFWEKHSKVKGVKDFFSDDFKELIQGMIDPDPKKRFTINDIKYSAWYTGETAEKSTISTELSKLDKGLQLICRIEEEKRKIAKQIAKLEENSIVITDPGDYKEYRGNQADTSKLDEQLAELDVNLDSGVRAITPFNQKQGSAISLNVACDLDYFFKCLVLAAKVLLEDVEVSAATYKIKGSVDFPGNPSSAQIAMKMFKCGTEGEYIVEFYKKQADYCDFVDFLFQKFIPEVKKLIVEEKH